jgi:hypothetical protein
VHIIQVIIAGWNNFRGIVTGFEVVPSPPHEEPVLVHEEPVLIEIPDTTELKNPEIKENDTI